MTAQASDSRAPRRIVCVPDSFKGSVTAGEAAAAMSRGAAQIWPEAEIREVPFADGGEGTLDALLAVWGVPARTVETVDALGRPATARYGVSADGTTAVIEAAEANGLPQVSDVALEPLRADTYGVGLIARAALQEGVEEILLCIGGSATTDGGTGLLTALGAQFLDATGNPVPSGGQGLQDIAEVRRDGLHPRATEVRWRIAVDVENPLTGPTGAAAVFGPQKGADQAQIDLLDTGLQRLGEVLAGHSQDDDADGGSGVSGVIAGWQHAPGFGAAGGMPVTLVSLLGAEVLAGATMVAEAVGLDAALGGADLILTGEGRLDTQSLDGKVVDAVVVRAPEGVPVVVIAGAVQLSPRECRDAGIAAALSIAPGAAELTELSAEAETLIEQTTAQACALIDCGAAL